VKRGAPSRIRSDSWNVSSSFQKRMTSRSSAGKSALEPTGSSSRRLVSNSSPGKEKTKRPVRTGTSLLSDPRYHPASQGYHPGHFWFRLRSDLVSSLPATRISASRALCLAAVAELPVSVSAYYADSSLASQSSMAYIRTIPPDEATGALKEEYETAQRRAGYVAHILRLQSLNPAVLHAGVQLYVALMHGPSALTRLQRELIATVVSRANDCFY